MPDQLQSSQKLGDEQSLILCRVQYIISRLVFVLMLLKCYTYRYNNDCNRTEILLRNIYTAFLFCKDLNNTSLFNLKNEAIWTMTKYFHTTRDVVQTEFP